MHASGVAVRWLRDNLGIIAGAHEVEALAASVPDTGDVYFVPAFAGLYAPRWQASARGTIVGMTQDTTRAHIARATLESVCFQTCELAAAMGKDCGMPLRTLAVDGGFTHNNLAMQTQADLLGIDVVRPTMAECTARGAAVAALAAYGRHPARAHADADADADAHAHATTFRPALDAATVAQRKARWAKAVACAIGWLD